MRDQILEAVLFRKVRKMKFGSLPQKPAAASPPTYGHRSAGVNRHSPPASWYDSYFVPYQRFVPKVCAPATDSPPPRADHGGSLLRLCTGCGRQYPIRNRAPRTYVRHTLKSFLHRMHTTCQTWELLSVPARHSPSCGRPVKTYWNPARGSAWHGQIPQRTRARGCGRKQRKPE